MAKTQATVAELKLVPVSEHPRVTAAQQAVNDLGRVREGLEHERASAWALLSPLAVTRPSEREGIRARMALATATDALTLHRLDELEAAEALAEARRLARAELDAAGHVALRPLVADLARCLEAAAVANARVMDIENALNTQPELRICWRELVEPTPMSASRLAAWRDYVSSAGLL